MRLGRTKQAMFANARVPRWLQATAKRSTQNSKRSAMRSAKSEKMHEAGHVGVKFKLEEPRHFPLVDEIIKSPMTGPLPFRTAKRISDGSDALFAGDEF